MIVSYELNPDTKLTKEQEETLEAVLKRPIVVDEDCPELTDEELAHFYRVADKKKLAHKTQAITLNLSDEAVDKAKSFGEEYTLVLSEILENVLADKNTLKRYL